MDLLRIRQGPQISIFLAGYLFSCILPLVLAQHILKVIPEPLNPKWGQNVLLNLQGAPNHTEDCQWVHPSGKILQFGETSMIKAGPFANDRVTTVNENCSLQIWNLTPWEQGNYSVTITVHPTKEQNGFKRVYQGYILFKVSDENCLTVQVRPQNPLSGQEAILIPEGLPKSFSQCEWGRITQSGTEEQFKVSTPEKHTSQEEKRKTVKQEDCSLRITQLTKADSGSYIVFVEIPSKHTKEPGKANEAQNELCVGQVPLQVTEQSNKSPHSGVASLHYKAGSLLGTLTWTNVMLCLFLSLFCNFQSLFPAS